MLCIESRAVQRRHAMLSRGVLLPLMGINTLVSHLPCTQQALRKSTAAMLRSGARPVAVMNTADGVELVWETLTEELTAVQAGKLSISVITEPAGIRWEVENKRAWKSAFDTSCLLLLSMETLLSWCEGFLA